MQATESSTPAANARYASSVLTKAADIIDGTVKRDEEWTVHDALRQATDEYSTREKERNETDRSYGMVALLKDLGKYIKHHPTSEDVRFSDDWAPVAQWSQSMKAETVTATLREAAPAIAEEVREWTARVEAARSKVQALNLSEDEVLEEVRKVRGK